MATDQADPPEALTADQGDEQPDNQAFVKLRFPAGPLENTLGMLIVLTELILGIFVAFGAVWWVGSVIGSLYHPWMLRHGGILEYLSVDWYLGILSLVLGMAAIAGFLHLLWEWEDPEE